MPHTSFELFAEKEHPDGFSYQISVDDMENHLTRFCIKMTSEDNPDEDIYQGIDLTPDECIILGNHLISIATLKKSLINPHD